MRTCPSVDQRGFSRLLSPHEHLLDNDQRYSLADLCQLHADVEASAAGTSEHVPLSAKVLSVLQFCENHVATCVQCRDAVPAAAAT